MKKRCTNSSCRKTFTVTESAACPHCGQVYPRLFTSRDLILTGFGSKKLATAMAIKKMTNLDPKSVAKLVEHVPVVLVRNLPAAQSRQWQERLTAAGADFRIVPSVETKQALAAASQALLRADINTLELSVRAHNILKRANINTVGDLLRYRDEDLANLRNMGQRPLAEIQGKLIQMGLKQLSHP